MTYSRIWRIVTVVMVLSLGIWLLGNSTPLTPESQQRRHAMTALSPGGTASSESLHSAEKSTISQFDPIAPTERSFADVVIDTTEPEDSMRNRWLRGEIDLGSETSLLSELEMAQLRMQAQALPSDPTVDISRSGDGLRAPTPGTAFDGLDYNEGGGSIPPDPELAVGPNHIVATVNVAVEIYDKSGTTVFGPTAAGTLFGNAPCNSGLYDPNVLYDEDADRWFLAYDQGAESATGGFCVLASQTGDPTGSWNEYFFPLNDAVAWLDYPHSGIGDEYIVTGANMFSVTDNSFIESRLYAFDKSDLYVGNAVSIIQRSLGTSYFTPQPLNLHGASTGTWPSYGNTHYILGDRFNGRNLDILQWDIATDTLTVPGSVDLGEGAGIPIPVPQLNGESIDGGDYRVLDFEYRNGFGWTTMGVSCNPGSGTVNCVRWAQIELASATLGPAGTGTYGSDGEFRIFPDLAVNHCDDMAVGYTKSSSSNYPAVWASGRESGDPAGTLQAEIEVKAGEIAYISFEPDPGRRWGDYTGMTIDPDGLTFWYLGEYSKDTGTANGRWGTFVGAFSFASCNIAPDFAVDVTPSILSVCESADAKYTVNLTALEGWSDSVSLTANGNPGTATFVPTSVVPSGSSTLTVSGTTAGNYTFDVIGSGGSPVTQHNVSVQLDVTTGVPSAVTLATPADGTAAIPINPNLTWNAIAGVAGYDIEIASDAAFTTIVDSASSVVGTNFTTVASLVNDSVYYWRARATNGCGNGDWSEIWAFRTSANSCAQTINSSLDAADLTYQRAFGVPPVCSLSADGSNVYYEVYTFELTGPGPHNLTASTCNSATFDSVLTVYQAPDGGADPFNAGDVCTNRIAYNDDAAGCTLTSLIEASDLVAGSADVVVTSFANGQTGDFELSLTSDTCQAADVYDYSDAPASYSIAWHSGGGAANGGLQLGDAWTAENSFVPGADENEGVRVEPVIVGTPTSVAVDVQGNANNGVWLQAWFDWNGDGDFGDSGEAVYNQSVAGTGVISSTFTFNATALSGTPADVRYRVRLYDASSDPGRDSARRFDGGAISGEVSGGVPGVPMMIDIVRMESHVDSNESYAAFETNAASILAGVAILSLLSLAMFYRRSKGGWLERNRPKTRRISRQISIQ